jgi:hypothetical protein
VILLGSIATGKYVDVLLQHFATKLFYPLEFVGRGDMSRGGLLLRSVSAGSELSYAEIKAGEKLTGKRPPKLDVLSPKLRITKEI